MILDLFSGVGGWLCALPPASPHLGIELDQQAAETSKAAGHNVIEADVTGLDPADFPDVTGLVASPPCTTFSIAGSGAGRMALEQVLSAVRGNTPALDKQSTRLTVEPLRWIRTIRPEWIALEQVPTVLPVWKAYAERLRGWGYSVETSVLDASAHGVPQSRRRAVLVASRLGAVRLPEPGPTTPMSSVFPYSDGRTQRSNYSGSAPDGARTAQERGRTIRGLSQPSVTVTRRSPHWQFENGTLIPFTVEECGVLQGFPPDYPWSGGANAQRLQIGNAIPPPLAQALITAATSPIGRIPRPPETRVGIELPKPLVKKLRIAAAHQGLSASALAAEIIEKAVAR
ncbi:MAG: DNA cytosine methyltransferase [Segniliparus sp.]|uniref:DNA cytosine methyltransferase n=1 Tax=Segniliparus sp. TaxID=2804064 RepID=UPI003F2AC713